MPRQQRTWNHPRPLEAGILACALLASACGQKKSSSTSQTDSPTTTQDGCVSQIPPTVYPFTIVFSSAVDCSALTLGMFDPSVATQATSPDTKTFQNLNVRTDSNGQTVPVNPPQSSCAYTITWSALQAVASKQVAFTLFKNATTTGVAGPVNVITTNGCGHPKMFDSNQVVASIIVPKSP